nr:MAG TPA: hypothetical protein [Caudoviricetes sp.]
MSAAFILFPPLLYLGFIINHTKKIVNTFFDVFSTFYIFLGGDHSPGAIQGPHIPRGCPGGPDPRKQGGPATKNQTALYRKGPPGAVGDPRPGRRKNIVHETLTFCVRYISHQKQCYNLCNMTPKKVLTDTKNSVIIRA